MSGADFNVLHVRTGFVYTSFPGDNRIRARVDSRHRRAQQNLIPEFDLSHDRFDVDAAAVKSAGHSRIFWTADDRSAKSDDLMDQIGALAGRLSGQIASETPTNEANFLVGSASE